MLKMLKWAGYTKRRRRSMCSVQAHHEEEGVHVHEYTMKRRRVG